ncbi:hypothetical protein L210DRAFT_2061513 [Boletus edulis BED1]|uniref:DUF6533 domain-containing protein n=1 Tax=Boletus edulis BED1 TaxID=1328754 RepID=A0AAD4CAT0_BOLED|nr:hypothetical protein L210DRAFT_2061513 [Boletus edulis BED1]
MSSDLQSTLQLLVLNDYASLIVVTVVVYDYILTFSREIEYVWCKPWTWVSTMFLVVRYIGLYWIMTIALIGSSFVSGPLEVSNVMYLAFTWAFGVFLSAADLVMVLRVYAMWNRSRIILGFLLFIFVSQVTTTVVFDGIYHSSSTYFPVTLARVFNLSFCSASFVNFAPILDALIVVPRFVLAATLLILAVLQTLKQSVTMYKATKQWQPNRYLQRLVRDGILYFITNMLFQINDLLDLAGAPTDNASLFFNTFVYITFYPLIPRFIISIRELYHRDIRGGFHVDTGFGVLSQPNAGPDTNMPMMEFMDGNWGPEVESGMDNPGDLEMGSRVHGSGLNQASPIGGTD